MQNSIRELIEAFQNPSVEYNPVMMWFWNSDIDESGITFQLEKFREQNVVQFFIHPAAGMSVPYMSDRFLELIKHVVKEAKRLGMKYWIYDENDWPSGMVGGLLREKYPESQQKELYFQKERLAGQGDCVTVDRHGRFLCAQRIKFLEDCYLVTDVSELCEITVDGECVRVQYHSQGTEPEEVLFWFSQLSDRVIYASLGRVGTQGVRGYINVLREEYVAKFIEMTHERYKAAIGEEFGKTVMGVFTDEPTSFYRFEGPHPGPWDDEFWEMFEEDHGYSLKPYLYTLAYEPVTPREIKAREDYKATVGKRYQKAFIHQVSKWCRDNHLLLTGHFGGEEDLGGQIAQGDMQTEAMILDIPGLDSIHSLHAIDNYNFNVAGKLIAAAAKYKGADRVLCETYTISGWNLRFPVMRRIANRLLMLGANMIQYMGAAYSMYGNRKSCGGPPHNYMNPMFQHYHIFNKYVAGIQAVSAATRPDARVLVFNPLRQGTQKYNYLEERHRSDCLKVQRIYEDTVNALLWEGISYDLFSEDLADQLVVREGYVEAFGYIYDCMVFPDMYLVNDKTARLIHKLKERNVKMIFAHEVPGIAADTAEEVGVSFRWQEAREGSEDVLTDGAAYLLYPMHWPETVEGYGSNLKKIIGHVSLNIQSEARVYIGERSNSFCKVYLICNDEDRQVSAEIDEISGMHIFDTLSCEEVIFPVKQGRVGLLLAPYEMLLVICSKDYVEVSEKKQRTEKLVPYKEIYLGNIMEFHTEGGNYLPVAWEMLDKETGTWEKAKGFYLPKGMRLKVLEPYSLRATVTFDYLPEQIYLHGEIYGIRSFKINGVPVQLKVNTRRFSEWDTSLDVTKLLHKGDNLIELEGTAEQAYCLPMLPFMFFGGEFRLDPEGKVIEPCSRIQIGGVTGEEKGHVVYGGWEQKGYPRFYGNAVCSTEIFLEEDFVKAELKLACVGPVEIFVNGEKTETLIWKPYTADITNWLKKGTNKIALRVTTTLHNIYEGPSPVGLTEAATLSLYK